MWYVIILRYQVPVLNHDQTDHNTTLVHSNSSMNQLLLFDIITLLVNCACFTFTKKKKKKKKKKTF